MLFSLPRSDKWVDIIGYENLYKVNKAGQILRIGGKVTTKNGTTQSYPDKLLKPYNGQISLSKNGKVSTFNICDLVAQAYLPDYKFGDKVYKLNGDSNEISNLSLRLPSMITNEADDDWKSIPSLNNYYQANSSGEIRSVDRAITYTRCGRQITMLKHGKILTPYLDNSDDYYRVSISTDTFTGSKFVHRLIAETFVPNINNKPQVNHIDGNKLNNQASNLEWVTRSENMQHAISHNLWSPKQCGDRSRIRTGIPVICITDNKHFDSITSAAKYYHMDFESVKESILLNRPRKGLIFKYTDNE